MGLQPQEDCHYTHECMLIKAYLMITSLKPLACSHNRNCWLHASVVVRPVWGGCTRECFVDVCKMIELSTKKPRNFQRNCEDSYNSRCLFLLHLSFSSIGLSVKNLSSFHGEVFLYNSKLFLGT